MRPCDSGSSRRRRSVAGFSLVELLAVLAIMAVLASIGMPLAELSHQRAREEDLRRSLREIRSALDSYKRLSDEGRIERVVGGSGYPAALNDLVNGVKDARSPVGGKLYFLRRLPRDPMAWDAAVPDGETWALRSYASPPDDPKPGVDVFDVHSRSAAIGLDGTPYAAW
jgi:general secretion pathway protein G